MSQLVCSSCGATVSGRFCGACGTAVPMVTDFLDHAPEEAIVSPVQAALKAPAVKVGAVAVLLALMFAVYVVVLRGESEQQVRMAELSILVPDGWKTRGDAKHLVLSPRDDSLLLGDELVPGPRLRLQRIGAKEQMPDFATVYASSQTQTEARSFRIVEKSRTEFMQAGRSVWTTYSVRGAESEVFVRLVTVKLGTDALLIRGEAPAAMWQEYSGIFTRIMDAIKIER